MTLEELAAQRREAQAMADAHRQAEAMRAGRPAGDEPVGGAHRAHPNQPAPQQPYAQPQAPYQQPQSPQFAPRPYAPPPAAGQQFAPRPDGGQGRYAPPPASQQQHLGYAPAAPQVVTGAVSQARVQAQFDAANRQYGQAQYDAAAHQYGQAQLVNNLAESTGLAQQLRQERHTTAVKPRPQSGWRKAILAMSFGLINSGESRIEREDRERTARVQANISPVFIFACISGKGGAAKTATTAALGHTFATCRGGGEVAVVDANPNRGNLAKRVNPDARHSFVDVLADNNIHSRSQIRNYAATSASSQLDVLAAPDQLVNPPAYDPETFLDTIDKLSNVYSVIGIDCGNDLHTELLQAILDKVTAVVVTTAVQFDSGTGALDMHNWLVSTGRTELIGRSFLLMSQHTPEPQTSLRADIVENVSPIEWHDPIFVPYDKHLYEASVINIPQLAKATRRAYLQAAAKLSDWYGLPPIPLHPDPRNQRDAGAAEAAAGGGQW